MNLSNFFVWLLSSCDLICSLNGGIIFSISLALGKFPSAIVCALQSVLYPWIACFSFFVLLILTYERYRVMKVQKPLNQKKAKAVTFAAFFLILGWASLPVITDGNFGKIELKAMGGACYCGGGDGEIGADSYVFLNVSYFSVCISAMTWCYYQLYTHIRNVFSKVKPGNGAKNSSKKGIMKEEQKIMSVLSLWVGGVCNVLW